MGLLALGVVLNGAGGEAQASPPAPDARPKVIATPGGLVVDWHAPPAHIAPQADGSIQVSMPGYSQIDRPGEPRLPFASVLIALPPDAAPILQTLSVEETDQLLSGQLAIAPRPDGVRRNSAGEPIGGAFSPATGTLAAPRDPIVLEEAGILRGVRLARLSYYPVRPLGQYLRIATHLRASVTFNSVLRGAYSVTTTAALDPLLASVRSVVINPDQVQLNFAVSRHMLRCRLPHWRNLDGVRTE